MGKSPTHRFVDAIDGLRHRLEGTGIDSARLEISLPYDDFQTLKWNLSQDAGVMMTAFDPAEATDRVMTVLGVKIIARIG